MISRKMMTNLEIYNKANSLLSTFENIENISLPVKVHFYFQKNMETLVNMARELEQQRINILNRLKDKDMEEKNKSITDLFSLEQEVKYYTFPIEWLENIELTAKQVQAFSFMIEEEE